MRACFLPLHSVLSNPRWSPKLGKLAKSMRSMLPPLINAISYKKLGFNLKMSRKFHQRFSTNRMAFFSSMGEQKHHDYLFASLVICKTQSENEVCQERSNVSPHKAYHSIRLEERNHTNTPSCQTSKRAGCKVAIKVSNKATNPITGCRSSVYIFLVVVLADDRPIAVSEPILRLYANILNARVVSLTEDRTLRAPSQAGFRPALSTLHPSFAVQHFIDDSSRTETPLYCCFLDLTSAYDSIHRPLLWEVLGRLGIHGRMLAAIQSLYATSSLAIKVGGGVGTAIPSLTGVKQGCPYSPTLFGLFLGGLHW
jgi:hypothetical protein